MPNYSRFIGFDALLIGGVVLFKFSIILDFSIPENDYSIRYVVFVQK